MAGSNGRAKAPAQDKPADAGDPTPESVLAQAGTDAAPAQADADGAGTTPATDAQAQAHAAEADAQAQAAADADMDAATETPGLTPAQRRKAEAEAQAKAREDRYALDEGAEWVSVPGMGDVGVCRSRPNAQGETFLYVVHRFRGKDVAIPLLAVNHLQDAGEV